MENKKNDDPMPFAIGVGGLVAVATISQKQEQIKWWLYDHMMMLVFVGFIFVALIVMRAIHRMKKKEEAMLARMRAARSVRPNGDQDDYYRRR